MVLVFVNIRLDPEGIHELVGLYDVRATIVTHGAKLFVNAVDVLDTKLLGTHAAAWRFFAAASPWADARGWGNCAAWRH
jgi:hypothetical protein